MKRQFDPPVILLPESKPEFSVIWLHGLGANGHDFEPIVEELNFSQKKKTKFIFPHAAVQPVTINGGARMRAWYDILEIGLNRKVDFNGIIESVDYINGLIDDEVSSGIDSKNILLAGFSQGGVIALNCALGYSKKLAAIIALSTYLPLSDAFPLKITVNDEIPVFFGHGSYDAVVPMDLGKQALDFLQSGGNQNTIWKTWPMEHSVCMEEITEISGFLNKVFMSH